MGRDLVVVGGGAAGLSAAGAGRRRGAAVTLINDGPLGGDCTFRGCVPSKTLLASARAGRDFVGAMADVARVVEEVAATESAETLRALGVTVLEGRARFVGARTLEVDGRALAARRVVLCAGAGAARPPIPGLIGPRTVTNEDLFAIGRRPEHLVVLGGGPIGVEMAEAFSRLGSRVTVVEAAARLLPREEPEASAALTALLTRLGVDVVTGHAASEVRHSEGVEVRLADGRAVTGDLLLVALGRTPATAGLGLEAAGVALESSGHVRVDRRLRTTARGVYAAGDVATSLNLTHVAYEMGRVAALNALGPVAALRAHPEWAPAVTYGSLEVARVGSTEAEVRDPSARVAFVPLGEVDRARATGETDGFVKLIAVAAPLTRHRLGGRLVGATIVAPRAGEMIAELALALRAGLYPARLALTAHPYPSWSVAIQQAAAQFFGEFAGRSARPSQRE